MDFSRLTAYLNSLEAKHGIPACDLAVFVRYENVYRHRAGFSDLVKTKSVSPSDIYWVYSMTKVFTSSAALQLIEQGKLKLDDPVSLYLPEFAYMSVREGDSVRPAKETLTIRHLFTMTGGFNYNLKTPSVISVVQQYGPKLTSKELIPALAKEPLDFEPGAHYQYSVCIDVLGAVIEAITGITLGAYLDKYLFRPLGASDITFWPDASQKARMSVQYAADPETGKVVVTDQNNLLSLLGRFESGGGGLAATLDSYALLPIALANGGVGRSGARILKPETIEQMRKDWLTSVQRADFNKMKSADYSYGLGVRTEVGGGKSKSPVGEFGWDGAAGAYNLIDPDNNIAAVYMQHVLSQSVAFEIVHPTIRDLIYEGLAK